jgi:hypothetical protein
MEYKVEDNILQSYINVRWSYKSNLAIKCSISAGVNALSNILSQVVCLNYLMHDVSYLSNYHLCRYIISCWSVTHITL